MTRRRMLQLGGYVAGVVLIVFGAGKLPRVMGDFAKGIKSFKANLGDDDPAAPAQVASAERPAR